MPRFVLPLVLVLVPHVRPAAAGEALSATQSDAGVTIKIGDALFTEYLVKAGAKPILWPILGPTGKPVTRAYPMVQGGPEAQDHPHQRSLWLAHGRVNGIDFWLEGPAKGVIRHRKFDKVAGGAEAVIVAWSDWIGPGGQKVCEERREMRFAADAQRRWIDFDIRLIASQGPVQLGDTKEGLFALRVAESIAVNSRQGGQIVDSEGRRDQAAWGKAAAWVDYHGPVDGQTVGIAVLNHPTSFRFPTRWHVRTYGLFAANPLAQRAFGDKKADGGYTIPAGDSITLRYRVLLHHGDHQAGKVAETYREYAK